MKMEFFLALSLFLVSSTSFGQKKLDTAQLVQLESHGDFELIDDNAFITVHARFTVEPNGEVSKIVIVKNVCVTCTKKDKKEIENTVKELIQKNPTPPRKDSKGKPKRTTYVQPFVFRLTEI